MTSSIQTHWWHVSAQTPGLEFPSSHWDLPLFQLVKNPDLSWLAQAQEIGQRYDDIVILGTGGSSLGAQTITALAKNTSPRLHFMENVDPQTFEDLFSKITVEKTFFLVISKSGETVETLLQFLTCWEQLSLSPDQCLIITEPHANTLRNLANKLTIACLDHPAVGGRFSCLSIVGLFPAALAGIDVHALLAGAQDMMTSHLPLSGAHHLYHTGKSISVVMPYCDRLRSFARWYAQLWAESLGKAHPKADEYPTTPLAALGTVDQHSLLQLFLGGAPNKAYTIITLDQHHQGHPLHTDAIPLFQGQSLGDLMDAEQRATIQTLVNHHHPVRHIHLSQLDEKTLGGLFMHFILETLHMAHLMGVNPFDQPAVEEGKILAKKYLEEKNARPAA